MMQTNDPNVTPWEGLTAEAGWYHNLRSLILDGVAAEMGGTAFLVYSALKCHTNLDTGASYPGRDRLCELLGLSTVSVTAATNKLLKMKLITAHSSGRAKTYKVVERVSLRDSEGTVRAVADTVYVPKQFKSVMEEIKAYCQAGIIPGKTINIVFNIALQTGLDAKANFLISPELAAAQELARLKN